MSDKPTDEKTWWLDRKENVTKVARTLYVMCAIVILTDLFARSHPETEIDAVPFFYGVYGFVGSVGLVLAAKEILRRLVMRSEDYYDD